MIVQKGNYNPFLKGKPAAPNPNTTPTTIQTPSTVMPVQATVTLNQATSSGPINSVHPIPMAAIRTVNPTEPNLIEHKLVQVKTLQDLNFAPIAVKWSYDFDILRLHDDVMDYLKLKREKEQLLAKSIETLKSTNRPNMSSVEISKIKIRIEELEKELTHLKNISVLDYKLKTASILSEYKKLHLSAPRVFGQKEKPDAIKSSRKTELVDAYLQLAVQYCNIIVTRNIKSTSLCPICNGIIIDAGEHYICSDCDSIQKKIEYMPEGGDFENSNGKRANYETGNNFDDIVLQYQGIYPVNIPDRVMEAIKGAINQYQNFDIKRLTRTDLVQIMRELGLGAFYKHLHRIWMDLTGNKPGDISRYVVSVNKRGALLAAIYNKIKPEDRSNFIHGIHLLWVFLRNEGCNPDMEDFVLLKSRDTELTNLDILKVGFDELRISNPEMTWEIFQLP